MMRGEAMAGVEVSRAETASGLGPAVTWEDPPVWPGGPPHQRNFSANWTIRPSPALRIRPNAPEFT